MPAALPDVVRALLVAPAGDARDRAWSDFLARYSDLMVAVARRMGGGRDLAMDRYAFAIEALRADDLHRVRSYVADGRGQFTTWLAVVVRRLYLDHHRQRYGRLQGETTDSAERHAERRSLVNLVGDELALAELPDGRDLDLGFRMAELQRTLSTALDQLEPADRLILRLRFEEGLSVPEIARALSAESPFRVYRRIDALLASLRTSLESAGVQGPTP